MDALAVRTTAAVFPDAGRVLAALCERGFGTVHNPGDGSDYQGICAAVPAWVAAAFHGAIAAVAGASVRPLYTFARQMHPGLPPSNIHTDVAQCGPHGGAAHVYLSPSWPAGAGTAFWQHPVHGRWWTPETATTVMEAFTRPQEWQRWALVQGACNRMVVHAAAWYHSAAPLQGWPVTATDRGRVVLSCFFVKE